MLCDFGSIKSLPFIAIEVTECVCLRAPFFILTPGAVTRAIALLGRVDAVVVGMTEEPPRAEVLGAELSVLVFCTVAISAAIAD